jgi:thiamine-monophosphate kinase
MGELELIERIRAQWGRGRDRPARPGLPTAGLKGARSRRALVLGIGDDCAILRPPRGHDLLVTTDFTLEGRHFRRDWHPPESAGHRALARGLSDLAAMGAQPLAAFLSLALPAEILSTRAGRRWVDGFFTGLHRLAERCGVPLAGGDTSESPSPQVLADIVLIGSAPAGRALRRSGGKPGDALYVTGALGGAAAELAALAARGAAKPPVPSGKSAKKALSLAEAAHPQLWPQPRLAVGQALLRRRLATAAIDLSDGLSTDLAHLCRESGAGAEIEAAALPLHPLAESRESNRALGRAVDLALHGGEDYELLFAARPAVPMPRSLAGVPITRIGFLTRGSGISLIGRDGRHRTLKPGGWEHFAGKI